MTSPATASRVSRAKRDGIHYTPDALADFISRRLLQHATLPLGRPIRVFDPACGDGALLAAAARALKADGYEARLSGCDVDAEAVASARHRLAYVAPFDGFVGDLTTLPLLDRHDVVIANPPYVRTQHLGAERSQRLAARFGLRGRTDLYQVFLARIEEMLDAGGVFGIITSNRFLVTRGGQTTRQILADRLRTLEIIDLGDTRLFGAAVLPAVLFGSTGSTAGTISLVSVYAAGGEASTGAARSPLDALETGMNGVVETPTGHWKIARGEVDVAMDRTQQAPWVATDHADDFAETIDRGAWGRFRDLGKIRVGIKTTADSVFIRPDWSHLGADAPEKDHLHPLLDSTTARRWSGGASTLSILYPYDMSSERRRPVDLAQHPSTLAYLNAHHERLAGRRYVAEAGRQWWEIWVPQQPSAWATPKIVFPDISVEGRFSIDRSGALVNGNCYWISVSSDKEDLAALAVAVGNSTLVTRYYDARFANKLYAGRRRFISQYVSEFPLPAPDHPASREAVRLVRRLETETDGDAIRRLEVEVNRQVWSAFGLKEVGGNGDLQLPVGDSPLEPAKLTKEVRTR